MVQHRALSDHPSSAETSPTERRRAQINHRRVQRVQRLLDPEPAPAELRLVRNDGHDTTPTPSAVAVSGRVQRGICSRAGPDEEDRGFLNVEPKGALTPRSTLCRRRYTCATALSARSLPLRIVPNPLLFGPCGSKIYRLGR